MNRAIWRAAIASAALTGALTMPAAAALEPPPVSCGVQITPYGVATCDGTIVWGAAHGSARVHSTAWVDAPRVSPGMTITYAWKIGGTYAYGHHYYGFGWSALGKTVSCKVLVKTKHGGYARYYNFGTVRPPA